MHEGQNHNGLVWKVVGLQESTKCRLSLREPEMRGDFKHTEIYQQTFNKNVICISFLRKTSKIVKMLSYLLGNFQTLHRKG